MASTEATLVQPAIVPIFLPYHAMRQTLQLKDTLICSRNIFCIATAVQRGDRFETECYYDTVLSSISQDSVTFGAGSQDEM